jgi:hypothetical protein
MYTEKMTEALAILGQLDPVSQGAGTTTPITNIDMSKFKRLLFIVDVGVFGASGTVDFKLRESKTSGGTYQDIANKAITQLLAAGGNNRIVTVEVRAEELDAGYQFVQGSLTIGTAASLIGILCLGGEANNKPGNKQNVAAVAQQVS